MNSVIFDLDGVLIDSEPVHYHAFATTLKGEGVSAVSFEYYKQFVGSTNQLMWETAVRDFGLSKQIADLRKTDEQHRDRLLCTEGYQPVEGARELVCDLYANHVKMAVASSSPYPYIQEAVSSLHIAHCFMELVSGESVRHPKPAPDIFLKAAKALSADPAQCIVIEDSSNGIKAAKAAGMYCIALKNPNSGNQDLSCADIILDSFAGLTYARLVAFASQEKGKRTY
ncbi:MAG: HAD family hydrolase [Christensenellales bacterium]